MCGKMLQESGLFCKSPETNAKSRNEQKYHIKPISFSTANERINKVVNPENRRKHLPTVSDEGLTTRI